MKKLLFTLVVALPMTLLGQNGYEIKITFKPFKKQYIYLGHYFGKTYPIIDSALLNEKSEAVFKGDKKLQGGIYLVGYPGKTGFFEILVDKQQRFSVIADTLTIAKGAQFINSADNVLFTSYQQFMTEKGKKIATLRQQMSGANSSDSASLAAQIQKEDIAVTKYRDDIIKTKPDNILTALLASMREPELTGTLKNPVTKDDSLKAYSYFKSHFFDGVNFWDGRLAYTPFFEDKIDKYFEQLVVPQPDSVIKELDWMLGTASINEEMTRFLLIKFVNRYLTQKYMWEDMIFVHLFEKYFANKNYTWLNEQGRKTITDRAYSLMSNIMGTPAANIELPDSTNKKISLYDVKADYIVVAFWDPTCGHCKEVLPKLDSFYRAKWKGMNLKMYAVAKETEGTRNDWLKVINEHDLAGWSHVYYTKVADKARTDANIPGYSQLYDVQTFPTLYLLDKEKRIIAKKLSYQQIDEVLKLKMKGQ